VCSDPELGVEKQELRNQFSLLPTNKRNTVLMAAKQTSTRQFSLFKQT